MDVTGSGGAGAAALAAAVLPDLADLEDAALVATRTGRWRVDDDAVDAGSATGSPDRVGPSSGDGPELFDDDLPEGFPEEAIVAAHDVTFEHARAGVLVHASAMVFDAVVAAEDATALLSAQAFVRSFVAGVAADARPAPEVELLGPAVVEPAPVDAAEAGARSIVLRTALAAVTDDGASAIAVDVGVVHAGPVVVLLWCARPSGPTGELGWARLVGRVRARCAGAAGQRL